MQIIKRWGLLCRSYLHTPVLKIYWPEILSHLKLAPHTPNLFPHPLIFNCFIIFLCQELYLCYNSMFTCVWCSLSGFFSVAISILFILILLWSWVSTQNIFFRKESEIVYFLSFLMLENVSWLPLGLNANLAGNNILMWKFFPSGFCLFFSFWPHP